MSTSYKELGNDNANEDVQVEKSATAEVVKVNVNVAEENQRLKDEDFDKVVAEDTFFARHIKPRLEKGFISNFLSFLCMILGAIIVLGSRDSIFGQFVLSFGLFAFSGGFTNWLAIKMLFDKVPGLYGSGIIPMRFKEIRETVKNVIMRTFFDEKYLEEYFSQKSAQFLEGLNLDQKIKDALNSEEVDKVIDAKLMELTQRPEGMMLAMMGMNPLSLKPMIKPFVLGMGTDLIPLLMKTLKGGQLIKVETLRNELDQLMSTKLLELTPDRVKKLMEDVMRDHLGWLIVWGNIFGGVIGIASKLFEIIIK